MMTKKELIEKKNKYLASRQAVDTRYENLQNTCTEITAKYNAMASKLEQIRALSDGLHTIPTLSALRDYLASIRKLLGGE